MLSMLIKKYKKELLLLIYSTLSLLSHQKCVTAFPTSKTVSSLSTQSASPSNLLPYSFVKNEQKRIGSILDFHRSITLNPQQTHFSPSRRQFINKICLKATASSSATTAVVAPLSTAIAAAAATRGIGSFFLTRILFLRGLAFVYFVAFLIAYRQNKALIGDNGITPARDMLNQLETQGREKRKRREKWFNEQKQNGKTQDALPIPSDAGIFHVLKSSKFGRNIGHYLNDSKKFQDIREVLWDRSDRLGRLYPTLLWFISKEKRETNINKYLDRIAKTGLGLSISMFVLGAANVPLLLSLWICQRSLMSVGGPWYGFGWEPQLAELTFHSIFMAPLLSLNAIPYKSPVPIATIWAMRWFLFRIMIGAGLIKFRSGDPKWKMKNLSTMDYFYETQPIPNPLTRYFHMAPKAWHKFEVLSNHFVELIAPWLLIMPWLGRKWTITGGIIQIIFQSILITSGNLSFLNWLTMLPAIYCFDDAFLSKLFSPGYTTSASIATYTHLSAPSRGIGPLFRSCVTYLFIALIAKLSVPVVKNLLSKKQIMNASFDPLRLVNTYGAFGTVEENRIELIIEAAEDYNGPWKEYQFKVKPGDVSKRPRFISPYHYRLDWLMWIASCGRSIERSPWMYKFLLKLLEQDQEVCSLLDVDPFASKDGNILRPKYIRVEKYQYKFNKIQDGDYWTRERVGTFYPQQGICSADQLREIINSQRFMI